MLDNMAMRAMRARTQHDYVRHVRTVAAFLERSPDTATAEAVRRIQLHQREHGVGESTINGSAETSRMPSTKILPETSIEQIVTAYVEDGGGNQGAIGDASSLLVDARSNAHHRHPMA